MLVLALKCHNHKTTCGAVILGENPVELVDRVYPIGVSYLDVGDAVLEDGQMLLSDLHELAVKEGWHRDGTRWLCQECAESARADVAWGETYLK